MLVVESHGTPGGDPAAFAEMNLRMLVLAGGRGRTLEDYSALAADADLEVTGVHDIKRTRPDHRVHHRDAGGVPALTRLATATSSTLLGSGGGGGEPVEG